MISSNKTKGFTLVELLIVIVVIAILAAISIVAYNGVTQKARDDERQSNARNLVNAAASYNSEKDKWPTVSEVGSFNTIKVPGTVISATDANAPSETDKNHYGYEFCKDGGGTTTNQNEATGVRVKYWKDVDYGTNHVQEVTSGKCS
ncbi:prepilin-type N-terminal cleavage/methylation domain-containing protein [Candidatus Saccharibacteria bacterium oral taxon 488]|mgnify:CR=1 FL=1|nr:prepilin-type N-terminal cleavage/methylation domain-containing protein [Candidatus Saccharibacteria bacterium oral taxon 488]